MGSLRMPLRAPSSLICIMKKAFFIFISAGPTDCDFRILPLAYLRQPSLSTSQAFISLKGMSCIDHSLPYERAQMTPFQVSFLEFNTGGMMPEFLLQLSLLFVAPVQL